MFNRRPLTHFYWWSFQMPLKILTRPSMTLKIILINFIENLPGCVKVNLLHHLLKLLVSDFVWAIFSFLVFFLCLLLQLISNFLVFTHYLTVFILEVLVGKLDTVATFGVDISWIIWSKVAIFLNYWLRPKSQRRSWDSWRCSFRLQVFSTGHGNFLFQGVVAGAAVGKSLIRNRVDFFTSFFEAIEVSC